MSESAEIPTRSEGLAKATKARIVRKQEERHLVLPPPPGNLIAEYNRKRSFIEDLYRDVGYWHDTGRKQYREGEVIDVLDSLLTSRGLLPSRDQFDLKKGETFSTSVTDRRMYASLYAKMHQTDKASLEYEYYPRSVWSKIFLGVINRMAGDELLPGANPIDILKMGIKFRLDYRNWYKKVRRNPSLRQRLRNIKSDIPNNYPILIGVRENYINPIDTSGFVSLYERRVGGHIPIEGITHLEVPLSKVLETERFLEQKGIGNLPVIPMELGEIFSSKFSLREHASGNPFKTMP